MTSFTGYPTSWTFSFFLERPFVARRIAALIEIKPKRSRKRFKFWTNCGSYFSIPYIIVSFFPSPEENSFSLFLYSGKNVKLPHRSLEAIYPSGTWTRVRTYTYIYIYTCNNKHGAEARANERRKRRPKGNVVSLTHILYANKEREREGGG